MADEVVLNLKVEDDGSVGGKQAPTQSARERRAEHRIRLQEMRENRQARQQNLRERVQRYRETRDRMRAAAQEGRERVGRRRAVGTAASGLATRVAGMAGAGRAAGMAVGAGRLAMAGAAAGVGGLAIGGMVAAAGAAAAALTGLAIASRGARDAIQFSPIAAGAQAQAEARETLGRFRRAQRIGPEAARFVEARSDIGETLRDIQGTITESFLPILNSMLEVVTPLLQIGEGILEWLLEVMAPVFELLQEFFQWTKEQIEWIRDSLGFGPKPEEDFDAIQMFLNFINAEPRVRETPEETRRKRKRFDAQLRNKALGFE